MEKQFTAMEFAANMAAAACYNRAVRLVFKDSQAAQLWSRWGAIMDGAAGHAAEMQRWAIWAADEDEGRNGWRG